MRACAQDASFVITDPATGAPTPITAIVGAGFGVAPVTYAAGGAFGGGAGAAPGYPGYYPHY